MRFLFDDYSLDLDRRELRRGAERLSRSSRKSLICLSIWSQNRDRVVTKDDLIAAVWGGRIVSESTLTSRITAARKAIGDSGEQQVLIRTIARKGCASSATSRSRTEAIGRGGAAPSQRRRDLRQEIHFCTAPDGAQIAYAKVGQGPPLVKAANWLNHLEYDWESPVSSPLLQAIAADHRFIRYDARGNGLSDWDVQDISFEASCATSKRSSSRWPQALFAVRHFAGLRRLDRLCGAPSGAGEPSGALRRLRARSAQARIARGGRELGRDRRH